MSDLISRADAIEAVAEEWLSEASAESPYVNDYDIDKYRELAEELFADIPSADAVNREEYTETDGVVTIEKQNANEVGEIKHIVVCSPNYTRYFYNESMPISADAVQGEWKHVKSTVKNDNGYLRIRHLWECSVCDFQGEYTWHFCPNCGARMKGGDDE